MEPNTALTEFRSALALAEAATTESEKTRALVIAVRLAETLDGWLSRGGYLPNEWGGTRL